MLIADSLLLLVFTIYWLPKRRFGSNSDIENGVIYVK